MWCTLVNVVMNLQVPQNAWNIACLLPDRAKYLSAALNILLYSGTNRCYNERGSRTNYVRSSITPTVFVLERRRPSGSEALLL